jgi:phosphatidate cytidylyltransferase
MKRILTAIVALPPLLYTVWNDFPYFFIAIASTAALIGLHEFYRLASKLGLKPHYIAGYGAGLAVMVCFALKRADFIVVVIAALVVVTLTLSIFQDADFSKSLASASSTVFGVAYVALLAGFLVGLRMIPDTHTLTPTPHLAAKLLTTFFAMVMLTDTGAYYTGRSMGRHKLAPRVSPGKTVEGSVGGFIAAALAGVACKYIFFPEISTVHVLILGAVIGIVGQIGDLAESLLKRGSGVKDSGNIFPGHGGMLDRIDSMLFCAPIVYFYSQWFLR